MVEDGNPYPGLKPFSEEYGEFFFGRDSDACSLRDTVLTNPVTLFYASSGAGKTSLLRAKFEPLLCEYGAHPIYFDNWTKERPYEELVRAIVCSHPHSDAVSSTDLTTALAQTHLVDVVGDIWYATGKEVVVILDQFEKFIVASNRNRFCEELSELTRSEVDVHIVLSFREDFLASLDFLEEYIPSPYEWHFRLSHLNETQAKTAIVQPALEMSRVAYAPKLIEKLLEDLKVRANEDHMRPTQDSNIDLPRLQIVCRQLWQRAKERDPDLNKIKLSLYEDLGAHQGIVRKFIRHEVIRGLNFNPRKKNAAARILDFLAQPSGRKGSFVIEDLEHQTNISAKRIKEVLDYLARKRVVISKSIIGEMEGEVEQYELTHDDFIRHLRPWIGRHLSWMKWIKGTSYAVVAVIVVIGISLGISWYNEQQQTSSKLAELREWPQAEREARSEAVIGEVTRYLWDKENFEKLIRELRGNEDLITNSPGFLRIAAETDGKGRLNQDASMTMFYNTDHGLEPEEIVAQWQAVTRETSADLGLVIPAQLQIEADSSLPEEIIRVQFRTGLAAAGESSLHGSDERIEWSAHIPPLKDQGILDRHELANEELERFFKNRLSDMTILDEQDVEQRWWLVPRWSWPVWKNGGYRLFPPERGIALVLRNRLLEEPQLLFTDESVRVLLKQARSSIPYTMAEALNARGGVAGVRRVLVEMAGSVESGFFQKRRHLIELAQILDAMAEHPESMTPLQVARRIQDELNPLQPEEFPRRLPGPWKRNQREQTEEFLAERTSVFEAGQFGSTRLLEGSPVRIYLSSNPTERLKTKLEESRKEFFLKFGVPAPTMSFHQLDDSELDQGFEKEEKTFYRIEVLGQMPNAVEEEEEEPSSVPLEKTAERIAEEVARVLSQHRTRWVTAEWVEQSLQGLPDSLREWIEKDYSLTDLKVILRRLLRDGESREVEAATHSDPDTASPVAHVRDLPWLLGSLVFWETDIELQDLGDVVDRLRKTQRALLQEPIVGSAREVVVNASLVDTVREGIGHMIEEETESAHSSFQQAHGENPEAAVEQFLAGYAAQAEPLRRIRLERACRLPAPEEIAAIHVNPTLRYKVEELLDDRQDTLISEERRSFLLCLLAEALAEESPVAGQWLKELHSLYSSSGSTWSADEKYVLAYRALQAWKQSTPKDTEDTGADQEWAKEILLAAFQDWADPEDGAKAEDGAARAESAFNAFREDCPAPAEWCRGVSLELANHFPESFAIAVGQDLARFEGDREVAERALEVLEKAEEFTQKGETNDLVLRWAKAEALLTLGRHGDVDRAKEAQEFLGSFTTNFRACGRVGVDPAVAIERMVEAHLLAEAHLLTRDYDEAAEIVVRGLEKLSNRDRGRLPSLQFFLHLAQQETEKAVQLAQEPLKNGLANDPRRALVEAAAAHLPGGSEILEEASGLTLRSGDFDRDRSLMILCAALVKNGTPQKATQLLERRWFLVDRETWIDRMIRGDRGVWTEMLIGYHLGKVRRKDIFSALEAQTALEAKGLDALGIPLTELRCQAHFYEAFRQFDNVEIVQDSLQVTLKYSHPMCWEYYLARHHLASDISEDGGGTASEGKPASKAQPTSEP